MRTSSSVFNAKAILVHVDSQTEAVISNVVSINGPIVDTNGGVAAGCPLHPTGLGAGPRWVRTSVLSMCNPDVHVVGLDLDALNGLDCV